MFVEIIKIKDSFNQIMAIKVMFNYLVKDQQFESCFNPDEIQIKEMGLASLFAQQAKTERQMIIVYFAAYICQKYDYLRVETFSQSNSSFEKLIEIEMSKNIYQNIDSILENVNSTKILDYLPQLSPSKNMNINNIWN